MKTKTELLSELQQLVSGLGIENDDKFWYNVSVRIEGLNRENNPLGEEIRQAWNNWANAATEVVNEAATTTTTKFPQGLISEMEKDSAINPKINALTTKNPRAVWKEVGGVHSLVADERRVLVIFDEKAPNLVKINSDITSGVSTTTKEKYQTRIRSDLNLGEKGKVPDSIIEFYEKYDNDPKMRPLILQNFQTVIRKTCMDGRVINENKLKTVIGVFENSPDSKQRTVDESAEVYVSRIAYADPAKFNDELTKGKENHTHDIFITAMGKFTNLQVAAIVAQEDVQSVKSITVIEDKTKKRSLMGSHPKNVECKYVDMNGSEKTAIISADDFKKTFDKKKHPHLVFESSDLNELVGKGKNLGV